jgi:DNA-binding MarR family transcriptional regulator
MTGDSGEDVFRLVVALSRKLTGEFEERLAALDLTPAQAQLLRQLSEPLPMVGAAERLQCDPSNVTGLVDRLERRGLVARKTTIEDRRVKQLELTPQGHQLRVQVDEIVAAMPALEGLSDADKDALRVLLTRSLNDARDD